jgi:hypothetical protein
MQWNDLRAGLYPDVPATNRKKAAPYDSSTGPRCKISWLAGGRERGAPLGAEAVPRGRLVFGRAPSGAVHGQDPPLVNFATHS